MRRRSPQPDPAVAALAAWAAGAMGTVTIALKLTVTTMSAIRHHVQRTRDPIFPSTTAAGETDDTRVRRSCPVLRSVTSMPAPPAIAFMSVNITR